MERNYVNINQLIVLAYIIEDYATLKDNLSVFKKENRFEVANKILDATTGKFVLSKSIRKFYKDNQVILEKLDRYTQLGYFIAEAIDDNSNLNYFYNYFINNINNLETIKDILNRLAELKFTTLHFNEEYDFTSKEYYLYKFFKMNSSIEYLPNIKVIPTYYTSTIRYITESSPYEMVLPINRDTFASANRTIKLNTLIFDSKLLPSSIDIDLFTSILEKKNDINPICKMINNSVDLSVSIDDLEEQFEKTAKVIESIENIKEKDTLRNILIEIRNEIIMLKEVSSHYDENIIKTSDELSKEKLAQEKCEYKKVRHIASLDID
jgi:hypothetical protein